MEGVFVILVAVDGLRGWKGTNTAAGCGFAGILRCAQDDSFVEEVEEPGEQQVSPLRFAPVEMTIPIRGRKCEKNDISS
jgi:hypothetical protein